MKIEIAFKKLIDECRNEEEYQKYIENNTQLIPREFLQNHGIQFNLVLRKLKLAEDYITDFFYLSKSSVDWNCVLVEIEKPQSRYFNDGTLEVHYNFRKGLDQIERWRTWFTDQNNFNRFINGTIGNIRVPLKENICFIKYVLVTGRRKELQENEEKRRRIKSIERDDFKIISYDSLCEGLDSKKELYLGVRKNEYLEIHSKKYISENIFVWMQPEQLRINEALRCDILENRDKWRTLNTKVNKHTLEIRLPKILNKKEDRIM